MIAGEVLPFIGGATQTTVVVVETVVDRSFFENIGILPYYRNRAATFGTAATQYTWADFERNDPGNGLVKRMRLAEALLAGLRTELNSLTTSFNNYTPTWASITGKPTGLISHKGSVHLGDVGASPNAIGGNESVWTISIPNQGSSDYVVAGSLVGANVNPDYDNDVMYIITSKASNQFKICIREVNSVVQNLTFDFAIIL